MDPALLGLFRAIAASDNARVVQLIAATPQLAIATIQVGATRQASADYFLNDIAHHVYAGDTALHIAAASHVPELVAMLLDHGADVHVRNRRGAAPLHYAADGNPASTRWNPSAQVATMTLLIQAGADPDATDKSGVSALHRAVRNRCAAAVAALLDGGADATRPNGSGSTPLSLAEGTTGRSGSGSGPAREQQRLILDLLRQRGA